ncbi:MAG: hypothetical protein CXZ00_12610 [Acidobacteria bacterium]|nr:MAG: hypothetical protein CXZ00_12610 [Acidobacteriota bacterium]
MPSAVSDCNFSGSNSRPYNEKQTRQHEQRVHRKDEKDAAREKEKQAERERKELDKKAGKVLGGLAKVMAEMQKREEQKVAMEAKRLQELFDGRKAGVVESLKDAPPVVVSPGANPKRDETVTASYAGGYTVAFKSADEPLAWDAQITDPEVSKSAKHLKSIVPPLPISQERGPVTLKEIYLGDDRLAKTAEYVIAGWEMVGLLGERFPVPYNYILIAGKTFIAGEDGAYLHLVEQEKDYDAASRYLKDPAKSLQFAMLVQAIRQSRPLPASVDPDMERAAQAICDPRLGHEVAMSIDAMFSREAMSAMLRKATLELVSAKAGEKFEGLVNDLNKRKALFDAVRAERKQMREMMALETTTPEQRKQIKAVIDRANDLSASIYKMERVRGVIDGMNISDLTDKLADRILEKGEEEPNSK